MNGGSGQDGDNDGFDGKHIRGTATMLAVEMYVWEGKCRMGLKMNTLKVVEGWNAGTWEVSQEKEKRKYIWVTNTKNTGNAKRNT